MSAGIEVLCVRGRGANGKPFKEFVGFTVAAIVGNERLGRKGLAKASRTADAYKTVAGAHDLIDVRDEPSLVGVLARPDSGKAIVSGIYISAHTYTALAAN